MNKIKHPLNWSSFRRPDSRPEMVGLNYDPAFPQCVFARAHTSRPKRRWNNQTKRMEIVIPGRKYPKKGPWRAVANLHSGYDVFEEGKRSYWARCMFWSVPIVELTDKLLNNSISADEANLLKQYVALAKGDPV